MIFLIQTKNSYILIKDFNSGLILQFGGVASNTDWATFPIAYTEFYTVVATMHGSGQAPGIAISNTSMTGFSAHRGTSWGYYWISIGY